MSRFTSQVVLITGASSGIGAEMARQFAAEGACLVLTARDAAKLDAVASECRAGRADARVVVVPTDVTIEAQCRDLIGRAIAEFGRLDALVLNAGMSMSARVDEITDIAVFETLMRLNYLGCVWCTVPALPHLKASRGRIVVISSLAGLTGVPRRSAYCASKHALAGFYDSLRIELAASGVSVTMVHPGFVYSDINRRALSADGTPFGERAYRRKPSEVMTTPECARQILNATAARRRELIMTAKGKLGRLFKLISPRFVDYLALRAIERGQ
jgi:NAD(P)-dependent dehydrogenase (short-subunit alcohol dehydrogenase family)